MWFPEFIADMGVMSVQIIFCGASRAGGHEKLGAVKAALAKQMAEKHDLTLNDLPGELAERHGITVHHISVWRLLRSPGLTHKKNLQALEQKQPEVREARQIWITRRQPFMRKLLISL